MPGACTSASRTLGALSGFSGLVYADPHADEAWSHRAGLPPKEVVAYPLPVQHRDLEGALIRRRVQVQGGCTEENVNKREPEVPRLRQVVSGTEQDRLLHRARRHVSCLIRPLAEPYSHLKLGDQRHEMWREWVLIDQYRQERREANIRSTLRRHASVRHEFEASFGKAFFFEVRFRNPSSREHTYQIATGDDRLRLIRSSREWAALRVAFGLGKDGLEAAAGVGGGGVVLDYGAPPGSGDDAVATEFVVETDLLTADGKLCLLPYEEVRIPRGIHELRLR